MLEMYRRERFREDLLAEQCGEVISIEERLREIDSLLTAAVRARGSRTAPRCVCGAPIVWGSHFCANCGRPTGAEPVVSCASCGSPLPADATFCARCGTPVPQQEAPAQSSGSPAGEATVAEPPPKEAAAEPKRNRRSGSKPDPWET